MANKIQKTYINGVFSLSELKAGNVIELEKNTEYGRMDMHFVGGHIIAYQDERTKPSIEAKTYKIKEGRYGLLIEPTSFTQESTFGTNPTFKLLKDKIENFFSKLNVYKELDIFAKRGIFLYGNPGNGKSKLISEIATTFSKSNDTAVVIWPTGSIDPDSVKDFMSSLDYSDQVKKLIFVMEDMGGSSDDIQMKKSSSGLLGLLDNVEQSFRVPTLIISTSNYPEFFLGNLLDRPQRFDEVIEVKNPSGEDRMEFLKFFSKLETDESFDAIKSKAYDSFSIAHIKEVVLYSNLNDITLMDGLKKVLEQQARFKAHFTNKTNTRMGL